MIRRPVLRSVTVKYNHDRRINPYMVFNDRGCLTWVRSTNKERKGRKLPGERSEVFSIGRSFVQHLQRAINSVTAAALSSSFICSGLLWPFSYISLSTYAQPSSLQQSQRDEREELSSYINLPLFALDSVSFIDGCSLCEYREGSPVQPRPSHGGKKLSWC